MSVQLIAVLELGYKNQGLSVPDKSPYWKYPSLWDKYNADCYKKAGFKGDLIPYLAGSSFHRLADIGNDNLVKLTKDHTEDMRSGKYTREQSCPFFGGYVLRIDDKDKFFPQCCSDLSDIKYWEKLLLGKKDAFYQGHPEPLVGIKDGIITFDFRVGEFDEQFVPTPVDTIISFDITSLKPAIETVKKELEEFSNRLKQINRLENLGIDNIDKLLILGDD